MKIFISWSGDESRAIAQVFYTWIQSTLQNVKPYFSPSDIEKGARWASEIADELSSSSVAVIFLTQANLNSNWIMFEAGAISKVVDSAHVCPLLFGIEPTDLKGPLSQFQATRFEKDDIKKLFRMINGRLGQEKLSDEVADNVFEKWWPDLLNQINSTIQKTREAMKDRTDIRTDRDILEELLATVRSINRADRPVGGPARSPTRNIHFDVFLSIIQDFFETLILTEDELKRLDASLDAAISHFKNRALLGPNGYVAVVTHLSKIKDQLPSKLVEYEEGPDEEDPPDPS